MNFFSKLFRRNTPKETVLENESILQPSIEMTAKEKQLIFIKHSLKPLLKAEGYKTMGNKWWKMNDEFFTLMELQNFSWNSRDSVNFCFNFTTGFLKDLKNPQKPTIHDGIIYIRESYFDVEISAYWTGVNGYQIDSNTDLNDFTTCILKDFKLLILPRFNLLVNKEAMESFYSDDFWGSRVKQMLKDGSKYSVR